ncbi:hypothetical protein DFH08DRAFT_712789, partial [Mycena albidolilacea]
MIPKKHLSGSQWKQRISNLRADIFAAKFRNAPIAPRTTRPSKEPDLGNDIKILDSYYFTKYFKAKSKKAQTVVDSISTEFKLNAEQDRAFRSVANHAIDDSAPQLRMYLGGVGGTGKTQVIKALVNFFEVRNEAHRFIVLGPTGTSAALLNGSTYHSILGIRDSMDRDSERIGGAQVKQVQERLRGVEYVFIDEVSMVSCNALYSISARL